MKYNNTLERHIKPRLGNFLPCDISSGTVAAFAHSLLEDENLSVQTVKDVLVLLQAILKFTANYFPGQFPYIEIMYPRETKREMSVLTQEQQKAFVDILMQDMDDCKFGILLALQTGLRIGEVCALKDECSLPHPSDTFATRCVEVGFEIKSLSEILGHSSTKITLDRYVHSSMELKKRNMEKLNELDFYSHH